MTKKSDRRKRRSPIRAGSAAIRFVARPNKAGAIPGTVVADPQSPPPKIHVMCYGPGGVTERDLADVRELPGLVRPDHVTWIDIVGLGDANTITTIGELFQLHPLALEDVVHVHQRAKVEEYPDRLFVVARMASPSRSGSSRNRSACFSDRISC